MLKLLKRSQKHSRQPLPAHRLLRAPALITITLIATLVPGLAGTVSPATASYNTKHPRPAHTARTLNVTDTAHLHLVSSPGSLLIEEGPASGDLPGTIKTRLNIGPTVSASFTIYTKTGTLSGNGTGKLHTPGGLYDSFGGTMTVSHGTGRYAHANGHGGLYGTLDRKTDALTVQTTGTLSY